MNDTSKGFRALVREKLMARSPEERLRMGSEMHESARSLVLASLKRDELGYEQKYALFLRFYGRDFGDTAKQAIKQRMRDRTQ